MESRGQALRDALEHHFVLKTTHLLGQAGPGRSQSLYHMQSAEQIPLIALTLCVGASSVDSAAPKVHLFITIGIPGGVS